MLDIYNFVISHFDNIHIKPNDIAVNCPFCIDRYGMEDVTANLEISIVKHTCHCWRCEYKRSWIGLVMDITKLSYIQSMALLYVTPIPSTEAIDALEFDARIASDCPRLSPKEQIAIDGYIGMDSHIVGDNEFDIIKRYLMRRGFGPYYWTRYNLGYVPNSWRVYIPIEHAYWQARAVLPWMTPKYMGPEIRSYDVLFNASALNKYTEIVITEGAFSAMAVGDNAIALMGKNPRPEQIARICDSDVTSVIIAMEYHASSILSVADAIISIGKSVELWEYENSQDPADWVKPSKSVYDPFTSKLRAKLA